MDLSEYTLEPLREEGELILSRGVITFGRRRIKGRLPRMSADAGRSSSEIWPR
jgi:hypothetical protein